MEEKYFIIDVKNRECGPFTEDELNYIGLFEDSLIFCADWSERKSLNQISELSHIKRKTESIKPYNSDYGKNLILIAQSINETKENEELVNPYSFRRKKVRIVVVSWLFFHVMAFFYTSILNNYKTVSTYSDVNSFSIDVKRIIWPFGTIYKHYHDLDFSLLRGYDKTEFFGYNLIFCFIWFLLYTKKQKS